MGPRQPRLFSETSQDQRANVLLKVFDKLQSLQDQGQLYKEANVTWKLLTFVYLCFGVVKLVCVMYCLYNLQKWEQFLPLIIIHILYLLMGFYILIGLGNNVNIYIRHIHKHFSVKTFKKSVFSHMHMASDIQLQ